MGRQLERLLRFREFRRKHHKAAFVGRHGNRQRRAGFRLLPQEGNLTQLLFPGPGHGGEHPAGLRPVPEQHPLPARVVRNIGQEIEMVRAVYPVHIAHLFGAGNSHIRGQAGVQRLNQACVAVRGY